MTRPNRSKSNDGNGDGVSRGLALGAAAVVASAGFAALTAAVARRRTAQADHAVRKRAAAPKGRPARRAAEALAPAGKWWTYIPGALASAIYLLKAQPPAREGAMRSRRTGAGAVFLAGVAATALNPTFDHLLPQPPPPPGHRSRRKPVFPSGHAFGPSAISLATAYVLTRERMARPGIAFPAALAVPAFTAVPRMMQEKHWASDVLGGLLAGVALAAACTAVYEAAREP